MDYNPSASDRLQQPQPRSSGGPAQHNQLAAFLRSRLDPNAQWDPSDFSQQQQQQQLDTGRSTSAPPAAHMLNPQFDSDDIPQDRDPRMDPDYAAYYYSQSRHDPRIPPPIYSPGQSWLWAPPGSKQQKLTPAPLEKFNSFGTNGSNGADEFDELLDEVNLLFLFSYFMEQSDTLVLCMSFVLEH
ncbi:hypothetical protein BCR33DRAFT_371715 [Rhizoclosmatium globosum]|uniref:Uncharacterized protein n=1 Tax=Rhizoclosmatium globosum TaxID=329046 RepID=A0A1Y2BZV1_9FUNG|nr:hypothetical protein BCR33DRAFT_371715 [Rhizoclosmatium globosum]|eukprot:ORY40194.1 hypothetical protein BCR33DRAFT_371715 [Rhizoclosmatium globosum]